MMSYVELGIKCVVKDKAMAQNYVNRSSLINFTREKHLQKGVGLKVVLSGKENYAVDGKWLTLSAGNFLVINHNQNVEVEVKSKSPSQGVCFFMSPEYLKNELNLANVELAEGVFHLNENHWLKKTIDALPYQTKYNDGLFFDHLLYRLYHENLKIKQRISVLNAKNTLTKIDALRKIEKAKNLITSTKNQKISLQCLADEVGLSKFHFARLFKTLTGTTPAKFQQNYRLESAFDDLKFSGASISELAAKYGFTDVHHFSNAFKQKYKISPSQID
jgi:AraC-like DNA-binding protein